MFRRTDGHPDRGQKIGYNDHRESSAFLSSADSHRNGRFEALDRDKAVRPTIIHPGPEWTLRSQPSLLAPQAAPRLLKTEEQRDERGRALDLLDALTRYVVCSRLVHAQA
jgi:hypothetical protein